MIITALTEEGSRVYLMDTGEEGQLYWTSEINEALQVSASHSNVWLEGCKRLSKLYRLSCLATANV